MAFELPSTERVRSLGAELGMDVSAECLEIVRSLTPSMSATSLALNTSGGMGASVGGRYAKGTIADTEPQQVK